MGTSQQNSAIDLREVLCEDARSNVLLTFFFLAGQFNTYYLLVGVNAAGNFPL